jgi:pyruvate/2-oxoglutarate dehydrogenase complex dihydrolipoamide acyltransferase (E2) component
MGNNKETYHLIELSEGRRAMINALDLVASKHYMQGLLEVDVSAARTIIAENKTRTGEAYSFTGFLIYCLAHALDENKELQAYLKGGRRLMIFENVDVGTMIEHKNGDKNTLIGHIIKNANHKTYKEIHEELRVAQTEPVPSGRGAPGWFGKALLLPWPLSILTRALMTMIMRQNPQIRISVSGTVFITSVGMFGKGHSGWGITTTPHSLSLVVGSMTMKPVIVEGKVEAREVLNLSVLFDHDVVDGAPATRFIRRLVELIESGYGLDELNPI